jgi:hypothetical protein
VNSPECPSYRGLRAGVGSVSRDAHVAGLTRVGGVVVLHGPMLNHTLQLALIAARTRRYNGLPTTSADTALAQALTAAMAGQGQSDVPEPVALQSLPLTEPSVTVADAAKQLSLSRRQTRRLAPKLGGRKRAGRWLLDQHAIDEHLRGKHDTWTETA